MWPATGTAATSDPLDAAIRHDLSFASAQLDAAARSISQTRYPISTASSGSWSTTGASTWTSGFFPGALWEAYELTGDPTWSSRATSWQAGVESQKNNTSTHDVGFMISSSFGNGYRLTGTDAYRQVVLAAATSLATRYSPNVGAIKSWNGGSTDFKVIIDNMMNLEILLWASKHGGQSAWYDMAVSHAVTSMTHHVRPDGSTFQLVNFDPATGLVRSKSTVQGYSNSSTWSRGQAWAIHGFTMTYRETGDQRFLDTARATADYYVTNMPPDGVPYWDFNAPGIPNEPRDTSAAAIAASGLIQLGQLESDASRSARYLGAARTILSSLSSGAYLAEGTTNKAILLHGTYNKPGGKYDTGLIWGDYYFLQALSRYRSVVGRVVDRATGLPIVGATVGFDAGSVRSRRTGDYTLAGIGAGSTAITAAAPGYASASSAVVAPHSGSVTLDIALDPTGMPTPTPTPSPTVPPPTPTPTPSPTSPPSPPSTIAFRSASSASNAGATTLVIGPPAGVAAGDVLVAGIGARGTPMIGAPAGWTLVRQEANGSTLRQALFVHVASFSEPASYTFTFSSAQSAAASIVAYSGVDPVSPIDASGGQVNGASSSLSAPSITTGVATDELVGFFATASLATVSPPAGMAERTDRTVPSTNNYKITVESADQALTTSGPTGARVATATTATASVAALVALRPASPK
jgi:unsaturated chondroitin disaccharide hydrolase